MNQKGFLTSWNDAKGFGFITPENGGERLFAHISAYKGQGRPSASRKVVYSQTKDEKGRLRAASFQYAGVARHRAAVAPGVWVALLIAAAVGGAVSTLYLLGYVPVLLPVAYGVMSLVTFLMYAIDKGAAESGNRRVPEGRLHLFRHKTRKTSFQVVFWVYVILNLAVLGWLLFWPDAEFARQALEIKPVMLIRM